MAEPELRGRTALVTGTNRGIGAAVVAAFAAAGANVVAHSRTASDQWVHRLSELAQQHGVDIQPVIFDVTDLPAVKSEISRVFPAGAPLHILVNNAGVAHGGLLQMTRMETIREVFEVNYFAPLALTQVVLRRLQKTGNAAIVNMASIAGLDARAGNSAYGASKAALIALTRSLAAEVAPTGVRVNAVAPGLTDTDMAGAMEAKAGRAMLDASAMGRLARPMEIADVVTYLASDRAAFVNGQVIRVDGGSA